MYTTVSNVSAACSRQGGTGALALRGFIERKLAEKALLIFQRLRQMFPASAPRVARALVYVYARGEGGDARAAEREEDAYGCWSAANTGEKSHLPCKYSSLRISHGFGGPSRLPHSRYVTVRAV